MSEMKQTGPDVHHFDMTYHISPDHVQQDVAKAFSKVMLQFATGFHEAACDGDHDKMAIFYAMMNMAWNDPDELWRTARGLSLAWAQHDLRKFFDQVESGERWPTPTYVGDTLDWIMNPFSDTMRRARKEMAEWLKEQFKELDPKPGQDAMGLIAAKILDEHKVPLKDDNGERLIMGHGGSVNRIFPCAVCGEVAFTDEKGIPHHTECKLNHTEHDICDPDDRHIPGYEAAVKRAEEPMPGYL